MVKWLVIGVGDITRKRVLPAILSEPRSNLRGILTRNPAKAAAYPTARIWTSLDDALQDEQIDAVYVASPNALHAPQTIDCLRTGKHVLCEKPMAMNLVEAQSMVAAAQETGRLLAVAYYRRLFPKLIRAKELLRQGVIGQPVLAEANHHGWLESPERGWLVQPALAGGGPLYDVGSHRIDACNFLFGAPSTATGLLSNAVHSLAVEDSATVLIDYLGGPHLVSTESPEGSRGSGPRAIIDVRWNSRVHRDQFRVVGTEGEMNLDPMSGPLLRYREKEELRPTHSNIHYPVVENFVSAVLDGAPLACPGAEAIWTDWVTAKVVAAARQRQI